MLGDIGMTKILGIFTCYNRKEYSIACLKSLIEGNDSVKFTFLAVDDGSTDGTSEALNRLENIKILKGDGGLYYSGGMRKGIAEAKEKYRGFDYCLFFNDDVKFYENAIEKMVGLFEREKQILVGATCDNEGKLSYGGVKKCSSWRPSFEIVMSGGEMEECDTFNANCVLIPYNLFLELPNIDEVYVHAMGDFDYGLKAKEYGCVINPTDFFVGQCNDNSLCGTWRDTSLSIKERIRLKESPKGLPAKQWFHFVRRYFGVISACYSSLTPYIKIIIGRS